MEPTEEINHITSFANQLKSFKNVGLTPCCKPEAAFKKQANSNSDFSAKSLEEDKEEINTNNNEEICNDRREKKEKPSIWPNSACCLLKIKFCTQFYTASAIMIASNLAITAAHNVYNVKTKEEVAVEDLMIFPGAEGTIFNFISKISKFFYSKRFVTSKGTKEDYALLILEKEIGYETGYFGLCRIDEEKLKSTIINVTGYPIEKVKDKPCAHEMWGMDGNIQEIDREYLSYNIYTSNGQNGSGIICKTQENVYHVVGVHLYRSGSISKGTYLTQRRIDQILLWLETYVRELESKQVTVEKKKYVERKYKENITIEAIQELVSIITDSKELEFLKLDFRNTNITNKFLRKILTALEDKKTLKGLDLNFEACQEINMTSLEPMCDMLASDNNICELSLDLAQCKNFNEKTLESLKNVLMSKPSISKAFLNFAETKVKNKKVIAFAKAIKASQNIPSIELDLDCFKDIENGPAIEIENSLNNEKIILLRLSPKENTNLKPILEIIKSHLNNPNIINFDINLQGDDLDDESLFLLSIGLNNFKKTSYLTLKLNGAKINNKQMIELAKLFKENQNYPIVEADLDWFYDNDAGPFIKFENSLNNQKNMSLRMSFSIFKSQSKPEIDTNNFKQIIYCNEHIEALQKDGNYVIVEKSGPLTKMVQLIESLKKDPNMTKFNFLYGSETLDDESVFLLAAIMKNVHNMLEVNMGLGKTQGIDDKALIQIADGLKEKRNIINFRLDLELNGCVTDESIIKMADILKNQQNLTEFSLTLNDNLKSMMEIRIMKNPQQFSWNQNTRVTEKSIIQLAMALKNTINIKKFILNLRSLNIGDTPIVELAEALKDIKELEEFDLNLHLTKVADMTVASLAEAFKNKPKLVHFILTLQNTLAGDTYLPALAETFKDKNNMQFLRINLESTNVSKAAVKKLRLAVKAKIVDVSGRPATNWFYAYNESDESDN